MTTAKEAVTVEQATAVAAEIGIDFERVAFDVEQFELPYYYDRLDRMEAEAEGRV